MGHIQRRGTKPNYRYRVRYTDDAGTERSKTFRFKADAEAFLTSVSHQLLAGTYIDPNAGKVTVKAQCEAWRKNLAHLRPSSAVSLEQGFRVHLYPHLGNRPLSAVRPSDIAAWQRQLLKPEGPLSPATVKRIRGQLSAMYKAAILDRVVNLNPVTGVRAPTVDNAEIVPLTPEQIRILETELPDRYRAVVSLVAGSGLRASEVFGLTVDRVDWLRRTVRVDRQLVGREPGGAPIFGPPKSAKSNRTVPLADVTVKHLAEHVRRYPTQGLLFTSARGGAITREVFGKAWRPVASLVGLESNQGLHQVRHFYASILIDAGRSVKEVQARLGHASAVETLNVYAHLWPSNEDGTRAAIQAALVGPSEAVTAASRPS
jgi:integrase